MPTPIAELYQAQRLSAVSPASPRPRSSSTSASSTGRLSRSTHRTSVSIRPGDDPFAPAAQFTEELGGEGWGRISEERPSMEDENGKGRAVDTPLPAQEVVQDVKRRPSLFKALLSRPRRSRSTTPLSPSDISPPILSPSVPPRTAPMRSRASLISFADATQTLNFTSHSRASSRAPSPALHPSGASSLRDTSSSRPSLSGVWEEPRQTHSRTVSGSGSVRIDAHPPHPGSLRRPASAMELLPPTDSSKAFSVLGGPRVTEANRKAVEKLTGVRTSVFSTAPQPDIAVAGDDEDNTLTRLGLALTTDAPTRRIVPDNARYSLASFTTTTDSTSAYDRSTQYSSTSGSFSRPGISPRKPSPDPTSTSLVEEPEEEEYDLAQDGGEAVSFSSQDVKDRPLSPPPSVPLPPLPLGARAAPAKQQTSDSANSSATFRPAPPRRLPPSASAPTLSVPPARPARSAERPVPFSSSSSSSSSKHLSLPASRAAVSSASIATLAGASAVSLAPAAPAKPLASLHLVAGLPKDPAGWTLASHTDTTDGSPGAAPDHTQNAVPRFWRPEVLGLQVTGEGERQGEQQLAKLSKEEVQKIQAKATKLAFDRDVEIIASTSQPPATTSIFSFDLTSSTSGVPTPAFSASTGAAWDAALSTSSHSSVSASTTTTYHCVSLLVWSHADAARSSAIRASLAQGAKAKQAAVRKAAKAARAGKKLGEKLQRQMSSPMGAVPDDGKAWANGVTSETEAETEGAVTETEWEAAVAAAAPLADLPSSLPLWLPYSIVLVSTCPLYSLLRDAVALSWARYHTDIASHTLQMERILNTPAPKPGEKVVLPVSAASNKTDTFFVATMPGKINWRSASLGHNFPLWPLFASLHADNLLTIAELALAPFGRVLFVSRNSFMIGLATLTFQTILELRGWRGLVHPVAHARDLRIYLEDPGPWLVGIPSASRSLALADLAAEVVVVDLDGNVVNCAKPAPAALTTGAARDKARRRLETAVGRNGSPYFAVPVELAEAFPGGRFRPLSLWDETRVLKAFDAILSEIPRTGFNRLFRRKQPRKVVELDKNALHVQSIVRKHASTFVDRRDLLEAKLNKANQKLAVLLGQTAEWQRSFETFRAFSEKITTESAALKTRLEKERREARRLTGRILAEQERHTLLEQSLFDMEKAKEQALHELANVEEVRSQLEQQRALLLNEVQAILQGSEDESSPLFQAVYSRVESLSHRSDTPSFTSRPGTSLSLRSSSRLARRPSFLSERDVIAEDEEEHLAEQPSLAAISEVDEEVRLEAMRVAVQETFRSISSRLSLALQNANHLDALHGGRLSSQSSSASRRRIAPSIATFPPTAVADDSGVLPPHPPRIRPPPSPDFGPFQGPSSPISHGFQPKPFALTPPISPDMNGDLATPGSFVTVRPQHRRIPSTRSNGYAPSHEKQTSLGGASTLSNSSTTSTPTAASLARTVVREAQQSAGLVRQASYSSLQRAGSSASRISAYSTDDDAQSFVSVSEGGVGLGVYGVAGGNEQLWRPDSRADKAVSGSFELEELAWTLTQQQLQDEQARAEREQRQQEPPSPFTPSLTHSRSGSLASSVSSISSQRQQRRLSVLGHGRQSSFGLDAPPVELFTRSVRGRHSNSGSVDSRGRALSPVGGPH
ncbi:hypothetical protein JCM10213v2_000678 [Rhodosporidiobolus nylandii]